MERRHQVFVSSTYSDLKEERREVIQALMELDCIPAGMELFPSGDDEQWELIKSVIDLSDYYIVIVGARYGSLSSDGLSFTEREYDYAVAKKIPIAGFIHENPGSIARDKSDLDPELQKQLDAFRAKVQQRMVKFYKDPVSLGSVVSRSMVAQIKRHVRPGWVRGEFAMSAEVREEMATLRTKVAEAELDKAVASTSLGTVADPSLAQGDDVLSVTFSYEEDEAYDDTIYLDACDITWNMVVEAIGPRMLDEASEGDIRNALTGRLFDIARHQVRNRVMDYNSFTIEYSAWAQILTQLRALGYIELGAKKRSTSDRGVYWRLTAIGDLALVKLLAVRRST